MSLRYADLILIATSSQASTEIAGTMDLIMQPA